MITDGTTTTTVELHYSGSLQSFQPTEEKNLRLEAQ